MGKVDAGRAHMARAVELASGEHGWGTLPSLGCVGRTHDRADAGCDWALGQLLLTPAAGFVALLND